MSPLLPRIVPPFPVTLPTFLVNVSHEFFGCLFSLFSLWFGLDHYRVLLSFVSQVGRIPCVTFLAFLNVIEFGLRISRFFFHVTQYVSIEA